MGFFEEDPSYRAFESGEIQQGVIYIFCRQRAGVYLWDYTKALDLDCWYSLVPGEYIAVTPCEIFCENQQEDCERVGEELQSSGKLCGCPIFTVDKMVKDNRVSGE